MTERLTEQTVERRLEKIARGGRAVAGAPSRIRPTRLSSGLGAEIAAAPFDLRPCGMLSGGAHDTAAFAPAGWRSVLVFLRSRNGRHNPDEAMNTDDVQAGKFLQRAWSKSRVGR